MPNSKDSHLIMDMLDNTSFARNDSIFMFLKVESAEMILSTYSHRENLHVFSMAFSSFCLERIVFQNSLNNLPTIVE